MPARHRTGGWSRRRSRLAPTGALVASMLDDLEDLSDEEIDAQIAAADGPMSDLFERLSNLPPKRLALLAMELQERLDDAEQRRHRADRHRRHGLPAARRGRPGGVLAAAARTASTPSARSRRRAGTSTPTTTPTPTRRARSPRAGRGFLDEVDRFDPELLRHLAARGAHHGSAAAPAARGRLGGARARRHRPGRRWMAARTGVFVGICNARLRPAAC